MTNRIKLIISVLILLASHSFSSVYGANVNAMRSWHSPEGSRLVFDVDKPIEYKVFTLSNPARVVVDLKHIQFRAKTPSTKAEFSVIRHFRTGQNDKDTFRVVIEISESVKANAFQLAPNTKYGQRLVVDLNRINPQPDPQLVGKASEPKINSTSSSPTLSNNSASQTSNNVLIVAVDAGHGGEDPGALGKRGTREKDVVLAIAKKLAARIDKHPRMRSVMIRKGDYYVGLGKRTRLARDYGADLFVSVHADAVTRRSVKGSSVYALSDKRASSEMAKFLAQKENAADKLGGVDLGNRDDDVKSVLYDLMMDKTKSESIIFARDVLSEMRKVGPILRNDVERASFAVLKSPDIPSILVETAFISNPDEEKKLKNVNFQNKIAEAIFNGIHRYAKKNGFRVLADN